MNTIKFKIIYAKHSTNQSYIIANSDKTYLQMMYYEHLEKSSKRNEITEDDNEQSSTYCRHTH